MKDLAYGVGIETSLSVPAAEEAIRAALADEGFGILTEIDVAATMKKKLDVDRAAYRILGACNPVLAHRALSVDEHVGLLLPCNVVVYETPSGANVEAMEPELMSRFIEGDEIDEIASEARERLVRALGVVEALG
jgi:uncharacterized protein (DUF302 family)